MNKFLSIACSLSLIVLKYTTVNGQSDSLQNERFSIHFQSTVIRQMKPSFHADYSGPHSLDNKQEAQTSLTSTLYAGAQLWKNATLFINPEIAGGSGLSGALGVGSATNGETFRVGDPAPTIYLARMFFKQLIPLSTNYHFQSSGFNQVAQKVPDEYLSITLGKVGVADYFDQNSYSHDPRTQFISWGLMNNGAWDYPANTRGYTPTFLLEYINPNNELRYAVSLMPKEANGNDMNWKISKSLSHTLELTHRYTFNNYPGAIRILGFYTYTHMGNYRASIAQMPVNPIIENTRAYGRTKIGFGINCEQQLTQNTGVFARASWNDGKNETWAFTEIDRSASIGYSVNGSAWKRSSDQIGIAYIISGLSKNHRDYLKAGGQGFMLGDGALNYANEYLAELYYSFCLNNNMSLSGFYQLLVNPGYNADRKGPVSIFSVRLHVAI